LTAETSIAPTDWRELAAERWQMLCDEVGVSCTLRRLLEHLSGEDVLETVRSILQRHLAAHLDLGFAAWRNPACSNGFFAAWKASAAFDLAWELDELPGVRHEIHDLPDDPVLVLETELRSLLPDEALWPGYLERLALELPGWSGMFLWRDRHPDFASAAAGSAHSANSVAPAPVDMVDYLAVRIFLERHLCAELIRRLTGAPLAFTDLQAYYQGQSGRISGALRTTFSKLAGRSAGGCGRLVCGECRWPRGVGLGCIGTVAGRPSAGRSGNCPGLDNWPGWPSSSLGASLICWRLMRPR
jgi:uncharacterized protein